jgi:hypothetical protein
MAKVLFQIPIQDGFHGKSWLLETVYDLDFLPDEGDYFHPLKNDPESGLSMEVYRRWWAEDGSVQINTHKYILDPPEDVDMRNYVKIYRSWWTEQDGNLVDLLLANGWWEHDPNKEDEPVEPKQVNMQFTQINYGEALEATEIYRRTKELMDIAERRIREGLASTEEVVQWLKFGNKRDEQED